MLGPASQLAGGRAGTHSGLPGSQPPPRGPAHSLRLLPRLPYTPFIGSRESSIRVSAVDATLLADSQKWINEASVYRTCSGRRRRRCVCVCLHAGRVCVLRDPDSKTQSTA